MVENLTTVDILERMVSSVRAKFPHVNVDIIYLNALKNMADVVGRGRFKVYWKDDSTALLNFYGFVFAGSGSGKDLIASHLEDVYFGDATNFYKDLLRSKRNDIESSITSDANDLYPLKGQIPSKLNYIKEHTPRLPECDIRTGTEEGIVECRRSLKALGVGSTSITISELAKRLKGVQAQDTSFLDFIMELYEGENKGKVTKGDSSHKNVKGVPNNFMAFTTLGIVMGCQKRKNAFIDLFSEGYARRAFMVYDKREKEVKPLLDKEASIKQFRTQKGKKKQLKGDRGQEFLSIQQRILSNVGHVIELDDDSFHRFNEYESELSHVKNVVREAEEEAHGRYWKALKLAGILAVIQGKEEVDLEDSENAIKLAEHFGKYSTAFLADLLKKETVLNTSMDYLEEIFEHSLDNGFNKTTINKMFRNASNSRKEEIIEELKDYAFDKGYKCTFKKPERGGNGGRYMLETIPKSEDVIVSMSVSDSCHDAEGYEWKDEQGLTLETAVALATCGNYSAGKFKDNYRNKENWLGGNRMLIFDVDGGTTIEEAKDIFTNTSSMFLDTACAIMPTKSHQKEKNGVIGDRFRVFLPLEKPIDFTDSNRFKRIMSNVSDAFNLNADKATFDSSRMFYKADLKSLEATWFNSYGLRLVDWVMFDHATMGEQQLNQVARMHNATFRAENKSKEFVERCVRKLFQNRYHDGNRNHTLYRGLKWCRDAGFTQAEAEALMLDVTSSSPLPLDEFKTTVRSAWK